MKASAKTGLEQFLTYRLHVLNKLAERGISERYQDKLGVTLPEARVIASVGSFGPFSIMELARHANLDKSQASRAAEALIKQGLVKREPSAEDGRVVLVSLTPEGRALYRKVMPIARKWNGDMFDCLDEQEKLAFGASARQDHQHDVGARGVSNGARTAGCRAQCESRGQCAFQLPVLRKPLRRNTPASKSVLSGALTVSAGGACILSCSARRA